MANDLTKIYSNDSLLITDDEIFEIKLFDENANNYERGVAYLDGEIYLIYRGEMEENELKTEILPGIYKDPNTKKYFTIYPSTDEEKEKYEYEDKISSIDPSKIIEMINTKEKILVPIPESSKLFIPVLNNNDDILKRLIKMALLEKNIDLDQYRHRFIDKNALFNFKQVIKGNNNLSILLFDRGCEALNLKYTIVIEEQDPENAIGNPLSSPISSSSDETYDL